MCGHNLLSEKEASMKIRTYDMFKFNDSFMYLGLNMFCYQSISTFYTIRNQMAMPHDMKYVIPRTYVFVLILVCLTCFSFYSFYGNENLHEYLIDYFTKKEEHLYFNILLWLFNITVTCFLPFFIISVVEQFHEFEW